jgi:hypothetical protein
MMAVPPSDRSNSSSLLTTPRPERFAGKAEGAFSAVPKPWPAASFADHLLALAAATACHAQRCIVHGDSFFDFERILGAAEKTQSTAQPRQHQNHARKRAEAVVVGARGR